MPEPLPGRWLDDVLRRAEERLPAPVWRYFVTGSREGVTATEAVAAWQARRLVPRVLRDVTFADTTVNLLGESFALPLGIAPTSLQRCADPAGELAVARAATQVGVPHVVSSNAGHRFADVSAAGGPWWLQVYVTAERDDCLPMLEAATAAGASAVVLTIDTPFPGTKYDVGDDDFVDLDLSWHRVNYEGRAQTSQRGDWAPDLTAGDITWLGERTGLPVVVKGVLHPDDAHLCVEAGVAAVWVSNHGGRQLDRVQATASALPRVAAAVGGDIGVYVDGGIRSGLDALTALALGADAVFLGRLPLFALAAGGEAEVVRVLEILGAELVEAMRLAGCPSLADTRGIAGPER